MTINSKDYIPYFYVIEHISSGLLYAGSKIGKNANPNLFLKDGGYYTSSKYVKNLIESDGISSFKIRIIKNFSFGIDAYNYETKFLNKVKARTNSKFLNKHNNNYLSGEFGFGSDLLKSYLLRVYGEEYYSKTKLYKQQVENTCLSRYNTTHYSKTDEYKFRYKSTCMSRYGVENVFQLDDIKEKSKKTKLELYGDENYRNPEKYVKTNLEKFGVEYPIQSDIICDKIKKTNLDKYGVENVFSSPTIINKIKETTLKKYGVEYFSQSTQHKTKTIETNLERYGVSHPTKTLEVQNKMAETNILRYGVAHPVKSPEILDKIKQTTFEKYGVYNITNLKVQCTHCFRLISYCSINRWHNDNCKLNPNNLTDN